ncbi:hypothetical protein POM88_020259 [Heracleum sosnowskyi]|uniref:Uncharacterized protein n=1 Tax=Heracleum sosnowskyi TaxID=360622 RepID=A0AAD8IB79_9APIA|nr:hypothetical protein POM88_020259 [Heracleum sosnowskyi]
MHGSPCENVVKINVHGVFDEEPLENGNQNGIVHLAMRIAFKKRINFIEVDETDNVLAFDILLEPDEDIVEEEGLEQVIQQINVLFYNFNKRRNDGSRRRN